MKKFNLLKVLGITFAIVVLLSWVIPAGTYSSGVFAEVGATVPAGLFDLVLLPIITIASFAQYGLLFLAIGGFYGILNKTGVYSTIVNKIVKKFKNKNFLIFTIISLGVLSSLTNLTAVLFILVPFFVTVLLSYGYKKITAFAATVGSILVGIIGTTYGYIVGGYISHYLSLSIHGELLTKFILLAISLFLLVVVIIKKDKPKETKKTKETKETKEEIEIPLYEVTTSKKSSLPLIIISCLTIVLLIIAMYNWYNVFEISLFKNIHESITNFEVSGYPLFSNLLGSVSEFGFFSNYDLIVILIISSLLISWIYNLKLNDMIESFKNGLKQMLKPALYAVLASLIFAFIYYNASSGTFVNTILDTLLAGEYSLPATIASSGILSFFYNDFTVLASTNYTLFSAFDANKLPIIAIIIQSIYGLVMLIAPTSIFLMGGLAYLDVSYKEWFKYIWKFLLIILGVVIAIGLIMTIFI